MTDVQICRIDCGDFGVVTVDQVDDGKCPARLTLMVHGVTSSMSVNLEKDAVVGLATSLLATLYPGTATPLERCHAQFPPDVHNPDSEVCEKCGGWLEKPVWTEAGRPT